MTKIDYKYKAQVLSTDLCKKVNQIDKSLYARHLLETTGEVLTNTLDYDTALRERCFLLKQDERAYIEAEKLNKARYKRVKRLKDRISSMLRNCSTVVFLTLTFSPKTLDTTSAESRRKYVTTFLSEYSDNYVANIDFGKKNNREHYHAVIDCKVPTSNWQFGHALAEIVQAPQDLKRKVPKRYQSLSDEEQKTLMTRDHENRLSKYIAKLTNHAIKETTKRSAIIYSRPQKAFIRQETTENDKGFLHRTKKGSYVLLIPADEDLPF